MEAHDYLDKIETLVDKVEDWSLLPPAPVVSVWMITFNHEAFIRQAIDGVLMQQTAFAYELVIGDDKSTDLTPEIIQEYQQCHPERIRLRLAKENLYSLNMKQGIGVLAACRGKYIALCEGDDYWTDPGKLQKQVDFLEAHPECSMCFHYVSALFQATGAMQHPRLELEEPCYVLDDLLSGTVHVYPRTSSRMFRREIVSELPPWFHDAPATDLPLVVLCAEYGKICLLNEVMSVYRVHSGGVWSGSTLVDRSKTTLQVYQQLRSHLGARHQKAMKTRLARGYLALAAAQAEEGDIGQARTNLRTSIAESPMGGLRRLVDVIALALRLYTPRIYRLLKSITRLPRASVRN